MVDDEQDVCEILQYNLETEGYEVYTANSAEEALELPLQNYSMLLLDVMMGEMSGFQLARRLRENPATAQIPIIFITALEGEDNMIKGLNIGADDYISKPLSMKEVKARVAAVLRRTSAHQPTYTNTPTNRSSKTLIFEGITIDLETKVAAIDQVPMLLTKLEFELLLLFVQNPNRVFSREEILYRCWPKDVLVLDRTVDVNITRLRKKMGPYGKQIKTRVGYGYYLEK